MDEKPDPVRPFTAALFAVALIAAVGIVVQALDRQCLLPLHLPDVSEMIPRGSVGSPTLAE